MMLNPLIESKLQELVENKAMLPDKLPTAIMVLFSYQQGIKLETITQEQINDITELLILAGLVTRDYESDTVCLRERMFVSPEDVPEVGEINSKNVDIIVKSRVKEFRSIFSVDEKGTTGLRVGSMGDENALIKKLIKWFKLEKFKYSWEDVLHAARFYVIECRKQNYKYLQSADYFVFKDGRSRLSSIIKDASDSSTYVARG
jgi:hypothetical protein